MNKGAYSFLHSIAKSSLFSVLASICSFLTVVIFSRKLESEDFANYLLFALWGSLAVLIIDCATEQSIIHYSKQKSKKIEFLWLQLIKLKFGVLFLFVILLLFIKYIFDIYIPIEFIFFIIPGFYLISIFEINKKNNIFSFLIFIEKLAFLLIGWAICEMNGGLIQVIISYFSLTIISLILQIWVSSYFSEWHNSKKSGVVIPYIISYYPVYLILILQTFYGVVSRLIIENRLGVAAFATATLSLQIINSISIFQTQVDRHIRPELILSILTRDALILSRILKNYLIFYVFPLIILSILLIFFSEDIIRTLYGEKWHDAALALKVLSLLLITIPLMRLSDMISIPLSIKKVNLLINSLAALLLCIALSALPADYGLVYYLIAIVMIQVLQIICSGSIIIVILKRFFH